MSATRAAAEARPAGLGWGELAGQALDAVSSRIAIVDESGTIVAVNRAWRVFAHTHGASDRQACEGTNFFKACAAPDDPQHDVAMQVVDGLQHVLDGTLPMFYGEEPCRLPHDLLWSEVRISPLKVDGRTMAIVSYDDITARKRVELALRDTEAAHDRAQKIAMVGSWTVDFETQMFHTSPEGARLLGWTTGNRPLGDLTCLIHPDDREWERAEFRRAAAEGVPLDVEFRMELAGQTRWVRVKAEFTHGPDGRPTQAFGVTQDITERRNMLDEVARERAQLRTLLDTIPDAVWLKDADGVYVACNPACEQLLQASEADVRGRTDYDFAPREVADGFRRDDQRAMAASEPIRFVETIPADMSGRTIVLETIKTRLHFDGHRVGVLGIGRDVTEQRRVSAALIESERLKQFALDAAQQGTWHQVVGTSLVSLDARARALWDVDDELVPVADLVEMRVPQEDHHRIFGPAATMGPGRYSMEFRVRRRDGSERWMLSNVQVSHDGDLSAPTNLRSHGTVQDITERRQNEETVTRFLSANPVVLYALGIVDGGFPIRWFSGNLQQMSGWSADEVMTDPLWWVNNLHPDDRQRVIGANALPSPGRNAIIEFRFRRPDGTYFWVRDEKRVLHDEAGIPSEIVGSWSDITQRVQLEERLRQSHKLEAIGLLAGGVAHDFNNLLTVIGGNSDLLRPLVADSLHANQLLAEIREAGDRAGALTRQLLAFSRSQVLAPKVVGLNELVAQVKSMLTRLIGEDIEFDCELGDDAGHVLVDAGQFEQVVLNMAVNARDAMPRGGRLTVTTGCTTISAAHTHVHPDVQPGQYAVLTMADTGAGMPPELVERIFEPFFTTKAPGRGTGLGLSMAFGIVKQSGGHIDVQTRPGHGTTFTVYLPQVAPVVRSAPEVRLDVSPRRGHETVLLVEDEDSVRKLARLALERSGYTVLSAENGLVALQVADAHGDHIDLLLTDVVMPGMRGPDLAHVLCGRRPGLKVLFISGYVQDALDRADVSEANFLLKPFSLKELAGKVRDVLDAL